MKPTQYTLTGGRDLVEPRQSALQRIQVGLVGLVVVLLFVSLANMVLDRMVETPVDPTIEESGPVGAQGDEVRDEPLAELGVTPVGKDDDVGKSSAPPSQNMQPAQPAPRQP
jgi:hypothetical protein